MIPRAQIFNRNGHRFNKNDKAFVDVKKQRDTLINFYVFELNDQSL